MDIKYRPKNPSSPKPPNQPTPPTPSLLPCCHSSNSFEYSNDTPIKLLLTHRPNNTSNQKLSGIFERPIHVEVRPMSSQGNLSTPPSKQQQLDNNLNRLVENSKQQNCGIGYSERQTLQNRIGDLVRQLDSEKAINKMQSEKIFQLTSELAGSRARANFLSDDLTKLRSTMRREIDQLKKEVQKLIKQKIQLQILLTKQESKGSTSRLKPNYESLEMTTARKTSTDQKRNTSNQTNDSRIGQTSNFNGIIEFKKRSDSARSNISIRKEMSSILLDRKQTPRFHQSKLQPSKLNYHPFGKNLNSFWCSPPSSHLNNHLILHK